MSGINYKFNQWRQSGEQAQEWSSKAYKLLGCNTTSDTLNGYKIGKVLYLHHVKGLNAQEIRELSGKNGLPTNTVKSVIKGFSRQAGQESILAYNTAMEMLQDEQERAVLERMYN
ncbi:hypothetical protein QA612_19575 [Evansella sp. AB-P1]|uniref:hypothetical protein n=1 Tax=Evansella sp. AB-P1 TaxID=3037653 RepID=UPI00241C2970|nr:hypothetical protein [Evansella sp. AB-P1]MDG5789661.1 hypothetical protein [Evansella sp. AB-P1]